MMETLQTSCGELGKFLFALSFIIIIFYVIFRLSGAYLSVNSSHSEVFFSTLNGFIGKEDVERFHFPDG